MNNARFSIIQGRAVVDPRVSDNLLRTLADLGRYTDEDGWCWPSLTTLGKDLGKSKQAAGRDVLQLKKLGYLDIYPQYKANGSRTVSKYRLKFDLPPVNSPADGSSTPEVDTPSTPEVDKNDPINDPKNARVSSSKEDEYNLLFRGDYRVYPEHLWGVATSLQSDWGFALPEKPKKGKGKQYGDFCDAMEQIRTAAAEFSAPTLLKAVREDFVNYMKTHNGIAPFTVGTPRALVTSVTAKARELRMKQQTPEPERKVFRAESPEEKKKYVPVPPELKERMHNLFGKVKHVND